MIKPLKALGALVVLAALIGGIPLALLTFYGNPIPQQLPGAEDVAHLFTTNDSIGFLLFVVVWIGWIAWVSFTLSVVVEVIARLRHIPTPQLRGLSAQQGAAAVLVAAIAGFGAPAAMAEAPAEIAPSVQTVEAPAMPTEQPSIETQSEHQDISTPETADLVITVQSGDTAWDLAVQHLGSGSQWREIVKANDGKIQPDGGALHVGEDPYLEPGWKLTIPGVPAPDTAPQDAEQQYETVTVERGQSLSSIADEHLGAADRWPEIAEASADITQPGGDHLQDPDQIDIGWTLRVPADTPAVPAPQTDEQPTQQDEAPSTDETPSSEEDAAGAAEAAEEAVDAASEALPGAEAPQTDTAADTAPAGAEAQAPASAPSTEAEETSTVPWTGVGSIFAASILGAVLARRLHTQRKRRADQRIPEAATVDLDQIRLTRIEDPTVLGFVDRALRTLSALQLRDGQTLPDVRLARLTDNHLELYASAPHELPAPFEATEDPATWLLPRTAALADDETIADIVAPYPALVTIGTDSDGYQILVDLEHLAALGIHAASQTSMPVMRALTVSLATSQWADDLAITTVGVCPELEDALGSGRITYRETATDLLDDLEAKLERDQEVLEELGHDSAQHARQAGDATDLWAPEIIIIGTDLSLTEKRRLQTIVDARPQIAVAVISSDQHTDLSEWRMHIESLEAARLEPLGLELSPQHLTDADYNAVLRALGAASTLEPAAEVPDEQPAAEDAPAAPLRPVAIVQPSTSTILTTAQREADPELPTEHPYIRVLGPIEILGADGPYEDKRLPAMTETVAYLHLNPAKPETDFRADLWPGKRVADNTRHALISRTRRWLGATDNGARYLPEANRADGSYTLDERVTSDWAYIQQIAKLHQDASSEQLAEALKLVRGAPFANSSRTRYRWSVTLSHRMIDTVLDLANELAQRALEAGDIETTLWATQQGLLVESLHEQLWRYRLQAAAHDPDLHQRITHDLEAQLAAVDDDYDLLSETEALMYTTPAPHRIAI
ncbi:LysM peptidoglycan-binding domain-containing protein [Brachybacterium alimentarium]|uniref:LysM peptidoglycan-binding domain-containing protein n=1 Tax=Brachybacterium alimentarium TaxID=47845 RepID=UPI003FD5EDD4